MVSMAIIIIFQKFQAAELPIRNHLCRYSQKKYKYRNWMWKKNWMPSNEQRWWWKYEEKKRKFKLINVWNYDMQQIETIWNASKVAHATQFIAMHSQEVFLQIALRFVCNGRLTWWNDRFTRFVSYACTHSRTGFGCGCECLCSLNTIMWSKSLFNRMTNRMTKINHPYHSTNDVNEKGKSANWINILKLVFFIKH